MPLARFMKVTSVIHFLLTDGKERKVLKILIKYVLVKKKWKKPKKKEEKYLGYVISCDGRNLKNIKARFSK